MTTDKFPYTSSVAWEFHTAPEEKELVNWVIRTRALSGGQAMYVAEIVYVMRRAGYSMDEIRTRLIHLLPRKVS